MWYSVGLSLSGAHYTELVRELAHARDVLGTAWPETRDTYIQHSDQTIRAISTAVHAGHAAETARLAHLLAGGSGMIGAHQLRRLCQGLERAAVANEQASCLALAQGVIDEFARVRALLQDPALEHHA